MKILVIGKNGQLGEELVSILKQEHNVIAFSRKELNVVYAKKVALAVKKAKPDIVINATAYHVVGKCEQNPEAAYSINAVAVKNLSEIAKINNCKFITISTDYVFDGLKKTSYRENDCPRPIQQYGISKLAGELSALASCDQTFIIRTAGIFGGAHGSRAKKGNFVLTILSQAKQKETLKVSMDQLVSPTYARHLAEAISKLITNVGSSPGIYHFINEGSCTWAEFAQVIVREAGFSTKIIPVDRRGYVDNVKKPLYSALKNTKGKKLGIVLPHWKKAVKEYIHSLQLT